jgi:hypothetical protein
VSLYIEVYVGSRERRKLVATTHLWNVSDLADVSDYEFISEEYGAPALNIPANTLESEIKQHKRKQSVWALVEKVAKLSKGK